MRKLLYGVFVLAPLLGSFFLGSWYNQRRAIGPEISGGRTIPTKGDKGPEDTETSQSDLSSMPPGVVNITSQKQQLIGVKVGVVERAPQKHVLRTFGRVAADENRTYRVMSSTEGWVSGLHESTTGSLVKKDQLMATVYNYQFLTRQQQYMYALEFEERRQKSRTPTANLQASDAQSQAGQRPKEQPPTAQQSMPSGTFDMVSTTPGGESNMSGRAVYSIRDQVEVAKLELYSLGVGDYQIQEIGRTKRLASDIEIRSPVTGLVLSRNISPQQRIERGVELFRIADLSRVWTVADIYGSEENYIKPGMSAKISLPGQEKVFEARVTDVPPPFDTASRALKVRLEAENPGNVLRPDMLVDVEFLITFPPTITVPADAVLDSGIKKIVFIDVGKGLFRPQEVETGRRFGNRVEIVKGLRAGDRIVMSGTFLIDSESRLELAAAGMTETLSKDPVCGADVSVNKAVKAGRKSSYQGKNYYFASDETKTQFDRNPGNWRSD